MFVTESGQIPGNNVAPQHPCFLPEPLNIRAALSALLSDAVPVLLWKIEKWSGFCHTVALCSCRVGRRSRHLWFVFFFLFHHFLTAATFESLPGCLQRERTDKIWSASALMSALPIFILCYLRARTQGTLVLSAQPPPAPKHTPRTAASTKAAS